MDEARRWANMILQCGPLSIRASKQALYRGLEGNSLAETLAAEREFPAVKEMRESADYKEGPRAFAEKRPAIWKGC
jgi:crotonobetainyl-CoA hydratase